MRLSRYGIGWVISLVICFTPLFLWFAAQAPASYLLSRNASYVLLAKSSALVGTAMFAWSLILSARLKFIEDWFNGLDKIYKIHRLLGTIGFGLLLLHPLFLSGKYLEQGRLARLWFHGSLTSNLGIIALAGMTLAIVLSVFMRLRHQTFLAIHRTLGAIFLVGALHSLLVGGELPINPPLRWYMTVIILVSALCYVYYSIIGQLLLGHYRYRVKGVNVLPTGVTELVLERRVGPPLSFNPGQFAFISLQGTVVDTEAHPFSIASGKFDTDLRFVIKGLGDYTQLLPGVVVGTKASVEGPYGRFSSKLREKNQVWIAGGIGITPFLSMARSIVLSSTPTSLYYCVKTEDEAVYMDDLQNIASQTPLFTVVLVVQSRDGFITADRVASEHAVTTDTAILICGPGPMMTSLRQGFEHAGVAAEHIYYEEFVLSGDKI